MKKFKYLNVPDHWYNYFTRYPQGYTILEALLNWVTQVNNMVDNQNKLNKNVADFRTELNQFIDRFDPRLQEEVIKTLSEWQESGFLDVVIDEALHTQMDELENRVDNTLDSFNQQLAQKVSKNELVINVQDFGVVGDGVVDDTQAMVQAKNYAISKNGTLFVPDGININIPEPFSLKGVRYIQANGEITCPELTIGYNASQPWQTNYYIRRIQGTLKIVGLKSGMVDVQAAQKVLLYANGDDSTEYSMAYSIFKFGFINSFEMYSEGENAGWINENIFIGGRVNRIVMDGNYHHNSNVWYNPQFDNIVINIMKGHSNVFHDCRFEGSANITFGEDTHNNIFEKKYNSNMMSYYLEPFRNVNITDDGFNNKVYNLLDQYIETEEVYRLDYESLNYNTEDITRNDDGTLTPVPWRTLFDTGLVEISDDFAIQMQGIGGFRVRFELFDENGEKLITSGGSYLAPSITNDGQGNFTINVNISNITVIFRKGKPARYVRFRVTAGSNDNPFRLLTVKLKRPKHSNVRISYNKFYDKLRGTKAPSGVYPNGTFCLNTNISDNTIGWIRKADGNWAPVTI